MIWGNPTITNKRIEIKEVASEFDLTRILKAINLSTLSFRQSYPKRRINSLYFDDSFFSSVEESYEGNSIRSKKRMRWYGQSKEPVHATLEIKEKQGHLSWKKLYKNMCKIYPSSKKWKKRDPQIPKSIWWHTDAPFVGFRVVRPLITPTEEEQKKYWKYESSL